MYGTQCPCLHYVINIYAFLVAQKSGAKIPLHISYRGTHIQYCVLPFNASGKQQQESWRLLLVLGYLVDVNGRLTN